jgi:hypothetical protein
VRLLCCRGRWRSLGEVRAAIAHDSDDGGRPFSEGGRSNIELATWTRRLAYEVGIVQPVAVAVPPLPSGASPATERAREGFRLLAGLRWADWAPRPLPYTVRFIAAWCGLSHGAAHGALRALIAEGVIREVEQRRGLALYLPGAVPEDPEPEPDPPDEDALIVRLIAAFDAKELPADSYDDEAARP